MTIYKKKLNAVLLMTLEYSVRIHAENAKNGQSEFKHYLNIIETSNTSDHY